MNTRKFYTFLFVLLASSVHASEKSVQPKVFNEHIENQYFGIKESKLVFKTCFLPFCKIKGKGDHLIQNIISTNVNTFLQTNNEFSVYMPHNHENVKSIDYVSATNDYSKLKNDENSLLNSENSLLNSGNWYKFEIIKPGVYKITNSDLKRWGIKVNKSIRIFTLPINNSSSVNSSFLYDDLKECKIEYNVGNDGVFNGNDYVLFYAPTSDVWQYNSKDQYYCFKSDYYSSKNYFYMLIDEGSPSIIQNSNLISSTFNSQTQSYDNFDVFEKNDVNILKSGKEWYSTLPVDNIKFPLKNIDGQNVKFIVNTVRDNSGSNKSVFNFIVSNQKYELFSYSTSDVMQQQIFNKKIDGNTLKLSIDYASSASQKAYLDKLVINYRSLLKYENKQFRFRDSKLSDNSTVHFNIEAANPCKVWDVSDVLTPQKIEVTSQNGISSFSYKISGIQEFVAFNDADCFTPTYIGKIKSQNLHAIQNVDMIIICANSFEKQAEYLQKIHEQTDGLQSVIVTQEEIFNEFSGGRITPIAIRDFVRNVYNKSAHRLKFLMLCGDGSYDNRKINLDEKILTYQTNYSLNDIASIVTDDFYTLLDEGEGITENDEIEGNLDIAVGRLPINNKKEADRMIKKITDYISGSNSRGSWRNKLLFLADDADGDQTFHMEQASQLADRCIALNKNLITDKIFLDAYQQEVISGGQRYPTVNKEIESKVKSGCLVFNYTGHGNPLRLTGEIVVDKGEVEKWGNKDKLPLFIAASCSVGRFDDENRKSLGEEMLVSYDGGCIATIASNRTVYSGPNMSLNSNIYDYLFAFTTDNKPQFIGEVLRLAKNKTSGDDFNKHNFNLLGDPALRLAIPVNKVITDKINNIAITEKTDTIKALSTVTIDGHIEDAKGTVLNTYNGKLQITVFDKPQKITTLSNDGADPVTFDVQNSIIFKGKSTVENGQFHVRFIAPKDIAYNIDKGRISYYVDNGTVDGAGSFSDFYVGSSSNNFLSDSENPKLRVFLNDTNFVTGGITNKAPLLLVEATDTYGINITGNSVGHDAIAILDSNTNEQINLNQFYEAIDDSYQKGFFIYPMSEMDAGKHSLSVKVWNINNKFATHTIDFIVDEKPDFYINKLYNYPNPFKTSTRFVFEHNKPGQELIVNLNVYAITGEKIKTITKTIKSEGNRCIGIDWDGYSDNGSQIESGLYLYNITLTSEENEKTTGNGKLIIIK